MSTRAPASRNELLQIGNAFTAASRAIDEREQELQKLLAEVTQQRERLQHQFEQLQAQNEELQAQHEEIQGQNEELQAQGEEIQAQHAQLLTQAQTLAEADEQKNGFLGLLAHELRDPLAAVSNSVFLLSSLPDAGDLSRRACAVIERQTRQLTRLIDDLLDITRISRGKIHLDRADVDLADVIRDCVEDHRLIFDKQSLIVDMVLPEAPILVYADRARISQIICNLLDNAVKFTEPGGLLCVSASRKGNLACFSVSDSGIGVDPAELSRLFRPFVQADPSRTRSQGGLGLGLALVEAFAGLHGGTVQASSEGRGMGATFMVQLPISIGDRTPTSTAAITDHERVTRRLRVLVVDDTSDAAESLRDALRLDDHDVQVAPTASEGLARMREFRPDVVFCDIGLPGMDGYEFGRRVRNDATLHDSYLVALTGYASADDCASALEAGFDLHLSKPATIASVRQVLAMVGAGGVR